MCMGLGKSCPMSRNGGQEGEASAQKVSLMPILPNSGASGHQTLAACILACRPATHDCSADFLATLAV